MNKINFSDVDGDIVDLIDTNCMYDWNIQSDWLNTFTWLSGPYVTGLIECSIVMLYMQNVNFVVFNIEMKGRHMTL